MAGGSIDDYAMDNLLSNLEISKPRDFAHTVSLKDNPQNKMDIKVLEQTLISCI